MGQKKKNSVATKGDVLIDMRTEFSGREQSSYQNHTNQAPDTIERNSEHRIQKHKFIIDKSGLWNLFNADTVQDRRCSDMKMCA